VEKFLGEIPTYPWKNSKEFFVGSSLSSYLLEGEFSISSKRFHNIQEWPIKVENVLEIFKKFLKVPQISIKYLRKLSETYECFLKDSRIL
jgi:hypothetical protein